MPERIAVYDIEVPGTHNFALASGVFVHNSAKQGRDRKYQAILPLRGKILNVEKARFDKMLENAEIRTMISALGTGVGKDEYNPEKLRYHKTIIMTDADVDGAHIRTLLLTFFFRMMPELIERGNLFIAQPPLYRVAVGKQETYLKDEESLEAFLLSRAVSKREVYLVEQESPLPTERLIHLMKTFSRYESLLDRQVQKGLPRDLVEEIVKIISAHRLAPVEGGIMATILSDIQKAGYEAHPLGEATEENGFDMEVWKEKGSTGRVRIRVPREWVESVEFKKLSDLYESLEIFHHTPYKVKESDRENEFHNPRDLFQYLMEEAKKGLGIQRYKGLGEMNPDQLWETTMNPEKRTLLQVRIEDQYQADELFTTLMGDRVEPRRDFIQYNALDFRELDI